MNVSLDEAITIYAKACRAWYGPEKAVNVARQRVEQLRSRGDSDGVTVWEKVAAEVGASH